MPCGHRAVPRRHRCDDPRSHVCALHRCKRTHASREKIAKYSGMQVRAPPREASYWSTASTYGRLSLLQDYEAFCARDFSCEFTSSIYKQLPCHLIDPDYPPDKLLRRRSRPMGRYDRLMDDAEAIHTPPPHVHVEWRRRPKTTTT